MTGRSRWAVKRPGFAVVMAAVLIAVAVLLLARFSAPAATVNHRPRARDPQVEALVRILGVLRRPQTERDLNPTLLRLRGPGLAAVSSLLRLATTTSWGRKVFVVPLVKVPSRLPLARSRGGLGIYFAHGGGICCETATQLEAGKLYANGLFPRSLIMVVPDQVAKISVKLTVPPGHSQPPIAPGSVHANIAALRLPFDIEPGRGDVITWYDAAGVIVKRVIP